MRPLAMLVVAIVLSLWPTVATASATVHVVAQGQTLGAIAKRYNVSIEDICSANRINRRQAIRPGQKLVIPARAEGKGTRRARVHVVAEGGTLSNIAKQHGVSVDAICLANDIDELDPIRAGQKLVIPAPDDADGSRARALRATLDGETEAEVPSATASAAPSRPSASAPSSNGLQTLLVPGAPPAYYFEPTGPGRMSLRPVIMYLHGRGGNPQNDCKRWGRVARSLGWVVCPSGPEDRGAGARGWNNNWAYGQQIVMRTLGALRDKYGRRVQLYGNTIVGFSEGAFVAMNVGVREPRAFNRWLILAADSSYWGGAGLEALQKRHANVRRVYLITGRRDGVSDSTDQVAKWLKNAGVPTRMSRPEDMGHEVALERKSDMYRAALVWLQRGGGEPRATSAAQRSDSPKKRQR
jgi:LysM repeat protein/predicted esterase